MSQVAQDLRWSEWQPLADRNEHFLQNDMYQGPAVYQLGVRTGGSVAIMYVGHAGNLRTRMRAYAGWHSHLKIFLTKQFYARGNVLSFRYSERISLQTAKDLELALLHERVNGDRINYAWNKQHSPGEPAVARHVEPEWEDDQHDPEDELAEYDDYDEPADDDNESKSESKSALLSDVTSDELAGAGLTALQAERTLARVAEMMQQEGRITRWDALRLSNSIVERAATGGASV